MPPLTQQYSSSFGQGYPTYIGNTPGLTSSSKVDGDDLNGPLSSVASMASVSPSTIDSNTPSIEPHSDASPSSFTTHLHQWGVQRPLSSYEEYNPMYPMRFQYQDANYTNPLKSTMLPTQHRNISHPAPPYSNSPYDSFYLHTPNQDTQTNVIVPPFQQQGNGVFLQQGGQPRSLQSFGYPQMSTLKQDLRQDSKLNDMHTNQKYKCPNCFKSFSKPYNLKSHMKTHSDARPYRCSHCSKSFARSHDRKRHELLHDGEKKFMCQGYLKDGVTKWGCGKKFARSDALSRHFRTETGWACIMPLMNEAKQLELDDSGQSHPLPLNLIKIKNEVKNRQDHSNS